MLFFFIPFITYIFFNNQRTVNLIFALLRFILRKDYIFRQREYEFVSCKNEENNCQNLSQSDRLRQKSWSPSSVSCVAARKIVRRSVLGPVRDIT